MRTQHVRQAGPERLADELEDFARDRDEHGKIDRARRAREAAGWLRSGAQTEVDFERVTYRVGDYDRFSILTGDRAEVLAELKETALGWAHQGKSMLALEAAAAHTSIEGGAETARAGDLVFRVA
jgi:hypothetical protein